MKTGAIGAIVVIVSYAVLLARSDQVTERPNDGRLYGLLSHLNQGITMPAFPLLPHFKAVAVGLQNIYYWGCRVLYRCIFKALRSNILFGESKPKQP